MAQLVEAANTDPLRGEGLHAPLKPLAIDAQSRTVLARHGWSPEAVPPSGEFVRLREEANVSAGGVPEAAFERVHPDNRRLAERAARAVGLRLAGVDLLLPDIDRSWMETGGVVGEVNAQPKLGLLIPNTMYEKVLSELLGATGGFPWSW